MGLTLSGWGTNPGLPGHRGKDTKGPLLRMGGRDVYPTLHMTASTCFPKGTSHRPPVFADSFQGLISCLFDILTIQATSAPPSIPWSPHTAVQTFAFPHHSQETEGTRKSERPCTPGLKHFPPRPSLHTLTVNP